MPATFPAHPAAVLPLKLAYPHRLDGVALVLGSAAPDLPYAVEGLGLSLRSHSWHGLFWFCVPAALLLSWLVRRAAPQIAAHLPQGGPLALGDYGVLAKVRHPLWVSAGCALIGAVTHVVWDTFTHPYIIVGHPFLSEGFYVDALHAPAVAGLPWWRVLQLVSEVAGLIVVAACLVHIGRHRLLVRWHGAAPVVARRPLLFAAITLAAAAGLLTVVFLLPGNDIGPNVIGIRLLAACVSAPLLAAAAVAALPAARA